MADRVPLTTDVDASSDGGTLAVPRVPSEGRCCGRRNRFTVFVCSNRLLIATVAGAVLGLVLGAALGQANLSPTAIKLIKLPGTLFLRALKMVVLPLIVTSVVGGVTAMRRAGGGGALAGKTLLFYGATTLVAVLTGLVLVYLIHPGDPARLLGVNATSAAVLPAALARNSTYDATDTMLTVVYALVPENIVEAAAKMDVLGLIVVSVCFALIASGAGRRGRFLLRITSALNHIVMLGVHTLVLATPVGVLSLLAGRLAESGAAFWSVLVALGLYMSTVLAGLVLHGALTLPLLYAVLLRRNPFRYMAAVAQALLTAFGTASSSATLPVSQREVVAAGVSAATARFVLPLGATVNMDGTALYEAVASIFIAQSYGIALGGAAPVLVALTAMLAAVGAAGIPEAGLVTMVLVLRAADLPTEGIALLLPVDWLLDRFRTVVNVWGDIVGAAIIDRFAPPTLTAGAHAHDSSASDSDGGTAGRRFRGEVGGDATAGAAAAAASGADSVGQSGGSELEMRPLPALVERKSDRSADPAAHV